MMIRGQCHLSTWRCLPSAAARCSLRSRSRSAVKLQSSTRAELHPPYLPSVKCSRAIRASGRESPVCACDNKTWSHLSASVCGMFGAPVSALISHVSTDGGGLQIQLQIRRRLLFRSWLPNGRQVVVVVRTCARHAGGEYPCTHPTSATPLNFYVR